MTKLDLSQTPIRRWWPYLAVLSAVLWANHTGRLPAHPALPSALESSGKQYRASTRPPLRDLLPQTSLTETANRIASPGTNHEPATPHISILTLNLKTGGFQGPDIEERTRLVAELIHQHRPDAVALQEVARSKNNYRNRGKVLADETGYHFQWQPIDNIPYMYAEGVALLSRWPIASTNSRTLPHPDSGGAVERTVLGGRIQHPRTPFSLFATHLNADAPPDVQHDQSRAVWSFVREHRTAQPAFVAGDFNTTPDSEAMKFLRGDSAFDGDRGDLVDAWAATRGGDPGPTSPAESPTDRIDYIYDASPPHRTTPRSCRRVLTEPVDGVRASDHVGVLCTFEVASPARASQ